MLVDIVHFAVLLYLELGLLQTVDVAVDLTQLLRIGSTIVASIGGAGNLPYKLSFYRNLQCEYHVLLDNDEEGRRAGQRAEDEGLLSVRNTTYTVCNGSPNSEIEDCYELSAYKDAIQNEFGVNLSVTELLMLSNAKAPVLTILSVVVILEPSFNVITA